MKATQQKSNTRGLSLRSLFITFKVVLISSLLFSCSGTNLRDLLTVNDKDSLQKYTNKQVKYYQENPDSLVKDINYAIQLFSKLEKNVNQKWGAENIQLPEKKKYVKYTNNYQDRAYIDFNKGFVRVETVSSTNSLTHLKEAIITTLLTPGDPNEVDIFTDATIPNSKSSPFLYEQVLDQDQQAIKWRWRASRYADYLIANHLEKNKIENKQVYAVQFALEKNSEEIRSYKYSDFVQKSSKKYNIDESLIYAIIQTESSFNPYAVSHANAYGLMQIIPRTAGRDVFERIKNRDDEPTKQYLFNPENNIDTGTAYLHILKTRYLKAVSNSTARHYSAISAYNGGASNVFKTFNYNQTKAINIMNQKNSQQIYDDLTQKHSSEESRNYLYKVNKYEKKFISEHK